MTEPDQTDLPYEQARDELISVVQKLETGGTTLEQSLTLWERGEELAAMCQRRLDGVRARLDHSDSTHSDSTHSDRDEI